MLKIGDESHEIDACKYAMLAIGIWAEFSRELERNERVMDLMEFVRELNPTRFDFAREDFARIYADFLSIT